MSKIKTIVVDDEAPSRRRVKKLLSAMEDIDLQGEAENGAQAISLIKNIIPDLVLLDIQLKDMTGFEVLKSIDPINPKIIFITAYDSYAIQAFEENAIDYLLKPYNESRFEEAINRVRRFPATESSSLSDLLNKISHFSINAKIKIQEGKTTHLIDPDKLTYIQSDGHYSDFHFEDRSVRLIRVSLKVLEKILPDKFVRINKSVIVNKDQIASIRNLKSTSEIELQSGERFSSSKRNHHF